MKNYVKVTVSSTDFRMFCEESLPFEFWAVIFNFSRFHVKNSSKFTSNCLSQRNSPMFMSKDGRWRPKWGPIRHMYWLWKFCIYSFWSFWFHVKSVSDMTENFSNFHTTSLGLFFFSKSINAFVSLLWIYLHM